MTPTIAVVIGSEQLGLTRGKITDLDSAIKQIGRERVVLRVVAILNVLALGKADTVRSLTQSYVHVLPTKLRAALSGALDDENAIFLEPWQQVLVLKRALVVCPTDQEGLDFLTESGEAAFFDACRFAADLVIPESATDSENAKDDPNAWVKVAAGFMPRLWMLNPPNPGDAIGRFNVMFRRLPAEDKMVANHVAALDERFPSAMNGLTFMDTTLLVSFLAVWSIRLKPLDVFKDQSALRLNPDTFLKETTFESGTLPKFLARTALRVSDGLKDDGGRVSPVVLRDRPFLQFSDGSVAPVFPPFLLEKLTQDVFWWLKSLEANQQQLWQDDWGYVAEAYAIRILERCAQLANCTFKPRLMTAQGEIDGVFWMKGHVAVIEITSSSLRETEGTSVNWEMLRDGLRRAFVENPGSGAKPAYKEAVLQLVRDVRLILNQRIAEQVPIENLQRVYPVMIATDRRIRTPGIVRFLQDEFADRLEPAERERVAGLAVLGFEDLETLESLIRSRNELQRKTPRGPLKVLRRWDLDRGAGPSWWQFVEVTFGSAPASQELEDEFNEFKTSVPNYFVPENNKK